MKRRKDLNELLKQIDTLKQKEYYSITEITEILNMSDTTIYRYLELGYLNKVKVFGRVWFRGSEIIRLINGGVQPNTVSK